MIFMDNDPHPPEARQLPLVLNEFGIVHYKERTVCFFASKEEYQAGCARWHREFTEEVLPPLPAKFFVLVIAGRKEYFLNVEDGSIFYEQPLKEI